MWMPSSAKRAEPPPRDYSSPPSPPGESIDLVLSYTKNVTPLDGNVRNTFGTIPLYRPAAPSLRMISPSDCANPTYRPPGDRPDVASAPAPVAAPTSRCCILARTTCDGYVMADAKSLDATPNHAHSNADGSARAFVDDEPARASTAIRFNRS